jgi:uncharacterized DUF497 family protein
MRYVMKVKYEWDNDKNELNFKKHGISFEEAQTVWADPMSQEFYDDEHSDGEERYFRIGHSVNSRILLVVFCERDSGDTIRIISARRATSSERSDYEG